MKNKKNQNVYRCDFCEGLFSIPNIPKVLPCLHVLCRDCIISILDSIKERGEFNYTEMMFYCPQCKEYIQLPPKSPEILPTSYNRIKRCYDVAECNYTECKELALGFCFDCNINFCFQHYEIHYE